MIMEDQPQMYHVLPCPCCGTHPTIGQFEMAPVDGLELNAIGIMCPNDECQITISLIDTKGVNEDLRTEIVVERWNKRAAVDKPRILTLGALH
jgi:hypothetical protein